jgi:protein SPT2
VSAGVGGSRSDRKDISSSTQKRKAEDDLQGMNSKYAKATTEKPTATPVERKFPKPAPLSASASISKPRAPVSDVRSSKPTPSGGTTKMVPSPAVPAVPAVAKAPPKKGSFAEIMARAKSAQAAPPQIGVIKHKPIERMNKKDRKAAKLAAKETSRSKVNSGSSGSRVRVADSGKVRSVPADIGKVEKRKPVHTSNYKGTARPAAPEKPPRPVSTYKGTANLAAAPAAHGSGSQRPPASRDRYRYASYSDEEEEEEDYESDASSDMEAGAFDVLEEEMTSARTARKEDLEAEAEERRHHKEKEERKRRLAAMAKKSRR